MAEAGGGFDIRRGLLLGGVVLVIVFSLIFFLFRGCAAGGPARESKDYTVIYSNLDLKDAANVIARLKELAIPYEIRENGSAIAVTKSKADSARLGLAESNLPAGGVVGWEIFDESRLGATDFDRRIQLIRAISGELSRTIRRIEGVQDVRVQIVLPETRLFAATTAPVTASVLLRLHPGAELSRSKINGIVHLVASSVENLQPENVTVIDNTGRILSALEVVAVEKEKEIREEVSPEAKVVTEKPWIEKVTAEAITEIAGPLTPEERILLEVRAKKELETDLTGKAQEILNRFYPPNSVIVRVNVELEMAPEQRKYKLSEIEVSGVNAVILIDNRVDLSPELKSSTFKSVAAAIGYVKKRGDQILLQKVPFHLATPPPEVIKEEIERVFPEETGRKPALVSIFPGKIMFLAGGAIALILALVLLRFISRPKARFEEAASPTSRMERAAAREEQPSVLSNVKSMADQNPERIAELLKKWLTE